jgi:tetratricopeptide (TPR) repeat protein
VENRRLTVLAGAPGRQALIALVVVAFAWSSHALAAPKDPKARAAFDQGIAAYQKQNYAGAAEAFGRSHGLEPDVETLFAWAQSERQQEHCEKAIELYNKLLEAKLPDENKLVVTEKLGECKKIIAAKQPPKPDPVPDKPVPDKPVPDKVVPDPKPKSGGRSRLKDPLGGVLVGFGAIGLGVGGYFLMSGSKANTDAKDADNYVDAEKLTDKAKSHGRIGVISTAVGGALLVGGIVRYATRSKERRTTISGWLAPSSGGVVALARF